MRYKLLIEDEHGAQYTVLENVNEYRMDSSFNRMEVCGAIRDAMENANEARKERNRRKETLPPLQTCELAQKPKRKRKRDYQEPK